MSEMLKAILFGIVEGITEWLPVSSTGHMIILDELIKLNVSKEFLEVFLVVIQLGAILAVVMLYWNQLWPFSLKKKEHFIRKDIFSMWFKVIAACIPAAVVGILFDDQINALFYNYRAVSVALILFRDREQESDKESTRYRYRTDYLSGCDADWTFSAHRSHFSRNIQIWCDHSWRYPDRTFQDNSGRIYVFSGCSGYGRSQSSENCKIWSAFFSIRDDDPAGRHGSIICRICPGDQASD